MPEAKGWLSAPLAEVALLAPWLLSSLTLVLPITLVETVSLPTELVLLADWMTVTSPCCDVVPCGVRPTVLPLLLLLSVEMYAIEMSSPVYELLRRSVAVGENEGRDVHMLNKTNWLEACEDAETDHDTVTLLQSVA